MTFVAVLVSSSAALLVSGITACGGDDGNTQKDAAGSGSGSGSGSGNTVSVVACTGTPPIVSTDTSMHYTYSTTTPPSVAAGSMIEFRMTADHDVAPASNGATDQGIKVDYGADVCLKFSKAGTYNFVCLRHGFAGSVVIN